MASQCTHILTGYLTYYITMFTGIIETTGLVSAKKVEGTNLTFRIESVLAPELKIDQSVSHNGVCLTVTSIADGSYTVTAVDETIKKRTWAT